MEIGSRFALNTALVARLSSTGGCGGGSSSSDALDTIAVSDTTTGTGDSSLESWLATWIINTSDGSEQIYASETSSQGVLEDVQLAEQQTIDGVDYMYVEATGIPNYDVEITQDILDALNSRLRATTDFAAGVSSASVGDVVTFGQDIDYSSRTENCDATGGAGYWPPGPGCPIEFPKTDYFIASPTPAEDNECAGGLGRWYELRQCRRFLQPGAYR